MRGSGIVVGARRSEYDQLVTSQAVRWRSFIKKYWQVEEDAGEPPAFTESCVVPISTGSGDAETWTMAGQLSSGASSVASAFMYVGWVYLSGGAERQLHLGKLSVATNGASVVGEWDGGVWSMRQLDGGVQRLAPIYSNMVRIPAHTPRE